MSLYSAKGLIFDSVIMPRLLPNSLSNVELSGLNVSLPEQRNGAISARQLTNRCQSLRTNWCHCQRLARTLPQGAFVDNDDRFGDAHDEAGDLDLCN
jgi:hypothetical protein